MGKNSKQRTEAAKQEALIEQAMKERDKQNILSQVKQGYILLLFIEKQIREGKVAFPQGDTPETLLLKAEQQKNAIANNVALVKQMHAVTDEEIEKIRNEVKGRADVYLYWMVD